MPPKGDRESRGHSWPSAKMLFFPHLFENRDSVTRFAAIHLRLPPRQILPDFSGSWRLSAAIPMNIVLSRPLSNLFACDFFSHPCWPFWHSPIVEARSKRIRSLACL